MKLNSEEYISCLEWSNEHNIDCFRSGFCATSAISGTSGRNTFQLVEMIEDD